MLGKFLNSLLKKKAQSAKSRHIDREAFLTQWGEIQRLIEKNDQSYFKAAILDADKLLDQAMRQLGFPGETMGERLKKSRDRFSQLGYNAAWEGHKIRNMLVHEPGYDLLRFNAEKAINNYRVALKDLHII